MDTPKPALAGRYCAWALLSVWLAAPAFSQEPEAAAPPAESELAPVEPIPATVSENLPIEATPPSAAVEPAPAIVSENLPIEATPPLAAVESAPIETPATESALAQQEPVVTEPEPAIPAPVVEVPQAPVPPARLLAAQAIPPDAQQAVAPLKKQALQCLLTQGISNSTAGDDDRLAAAETLLATQQPLFATLDLMRWRSAAGTTLPSGFWALQAKAFIAAGTADWATAILADPAARFSANEKLQLRLALAEWRYQHGEYSAAQQLLTPLKTSMQRAPQAVAQASRQVLAEAQKYANTQAQWQDLQARIDLAESRNAEAVKVLTTSAQNDPAQTAFGNTGGARQAPYLQYNLGVSLIRAGRVADGRAVLDGVGRMPADSSELLALKDKANLALGWQFLEEKQGATATAIFERVRIDGPFSNRALLGIGWAELADKGQRQARPATGSELTARDQLPPNVVASMLRTGAISCEEANRYEGFAPVPCNNAQFSRAKLPTDKAALLKRALVPWLELAERDPLDTAVQESWLAIPYALQQLDARAEAAQQYAEAIQRLEGLRLIVVAAIASAEAGQLLPPALPELRPSTVALDARFDESNSELQRLLAPVLPEHLWHVALQDERDLQWLAQQLEAAPPSPLQRRCGATLPAQLRSTATARRIALDQQAAAVLREKLGMIDRYLLAARAAMSRGVDPIPGAAAAKLDSSEPSGNAVMRTLSNLLDWFRRKPAQQP